VSETTGDFQAVATQPVFGKTTSRDLALRTHPLVFGVVMFLASELMFFGSLLAAYFNLRASDSPWPPAGVTLDTLESSIGTGLLALSSLTMALTTHYIAKGATLVARLWLGATMLLGTAFELIALQGWIRAPFRIDSHAYGTIYYALTGFHFLHVAAGIILLGILFASMRMAAFERDNRAGVEAIGFYWHFVFAVWVLIWGTIYFVR
jgi:cytochrome c oxidase subunit 3